MQAPAQSSAKNVKPPRGKAFSDPECVAITKSMKQQHVSHQLQQQQQLYVVASTRKRKKTMPNKKITVARALVHHGWSVLVSFPMFTVFSLRTSGPFPM
jgi:hypothetical protein